MTSPEEYLGITGVPRRAAYLLFLLVALYFIATFSISWGPSGLPIAIFASYLAVYVALRQVEGVVEDKLDC